MNDARIHFGLHSDDTARHAPWEGFLLAYAAMGPTIGGTVAYFVLSGSGASLVLRLMIVWSGAILCFLAGVPRGLSFRQAGGPLLTQVLTMLWLFALGFGSLVVPWASVALTLQILGYATMAIFDPIAAREGAAPRYFARLRPVQMMLPIVSLSLILASLVA